MGSSLERMQVPLQYAHKGVDVAWKVRQIGQHSTPVSRHQVVSFLEEVISDKNAVVIMCVSPETLSEIMVTAESLGFDNGEYVFFNIDLFAPDNRLLRPWVQSSQQHPGVATKPRFETPIKAFRPMITITLKKPNSTLFNEFAQEVKRRAAEMFPNDNPYKVHEVNSFVTSFYDAILLYANVLRDNAEHLAYMRMANGAFDGTKLTAKMRNRSFSSVTGQVYIDEYGVRASDYAFMAYSSQTGQFENIAEYKGRSSSFHWLKPIETIEWYAGEPFPPPNVPRCGYKKQKCNEPPPNTVLLISLIVASILIVLIIVFGAAFVRVWMKFRQQEDRWKIRWDELQLHSKLYKNGRAAGRATVTNISAIIDETSEHEASFCSYDAVDEVIGAAKGRKMQIKTAVYKDKMVALKPIYRSNRQDWIRPGVELEMKKMKDLQSDNIVKFHGACIDGPQQFIVTEYCPKGSLRDVLENDHLKLDWIFRYSLMQDIIRGMIYIHSSVLRSHGNLKSSNCVVDSKFNVKLTDFGLPTLRKNSSVEFACDDEQAFYEGYFLLS